MCAAHKLPPLLFAGDDDDSSSVDSPSYDGDGRLSPLATVVDASDEAAGQPSSEALAPVAEVGEQPFRPLTETAASANPTVEAASDSTQLAGPSQLSREHSYQLQSRILRPPNAFLLFAREKRPLVAAENPNDDSQRVNVRLGELWRSLEDAEKQRYRDQASQAANEHRKKYPDYAYSPNEARMRKDQECKVREIIANFKKGTSPPAKQRTTPVTKRRRPPAQDREQRKSPPRKKRPVAKKATQRARTTTATGSKPGQEPNAVVKAMPSSSSASFREILADLETEQRGSTSVTPVSLPQLPVPSSAEMSLSTESAVSEGTLWTAVVDQLGTLLDWDGYIDSILPSCDFPEAPPPLPLLEPSIPAAVLPQASQMMLQAQFNAAPPQIRPALYDASTTLPSAVDQWLQQTMVQASPAPVGPLTPYDVGHNGAASDGPHSGPFDAMSALNIYYTQPADVLQTTVVPNEATQAPPPLPLATQHDLELIFSSSASHPMAEAVVITGQPVIDAEQWPIFTLLGQHGMSGSSQQYSQPPSLPPSALNVPGPAPSTSGYAALQPEQVVPPHRTGSEPARAPQLGDDVLKDHLLECSSSPPLGLDEIVDYILSLEQEDCS